MTRFFTQVLSGDIQIEQQPPVIIENTQVFSPEMMINPELASVSTFEEIKDSKSSLSAASLPFSAGSGIKIGTRSAQA